MQTTCRETPSTNPPPVAAPDIAARRPTSHGALLAALLGASLLAAGCAVPFGRDAASSVATDPEPPGVGRYTVRRGDRLGDIALERTGEIGRWQDIAAHNGIDDPRTLRVGAVLEIPLALLPGRESTAVAGTPTPVETRRRGSGALAARGVPEECGDTGRA